MSKEVATTGGASSALDEFRAAMGGGALPGLEDVRQEDLTIPVVQIDHQAGKFVDKLTGEQFDTLDNVVMLGMFKSRIMWPPQQSAPGQKPQPLCRSREATQGVPGEAFPWADFAKGRDKNPDWSPEAVGAERIACVSCYFAQWGSDPKTDGPRCTLQYVVPLLGNADSDHRLRGLLTLQRTGIKPTNDYISGFIRDGLPLFMHYTTIGLNVGRNGTVQFAKPKFSRGEATPADVALWRSWSKQFDEIKATMQAGGAGTRDADTVTATKSTGKITEPAF